ncbi:MAG TPA: gluconate 2-dehydrogenase subunit 3 family protein [Steroidobacteraceae bacterium]|jgi:gluconate 2-dehydrogenase gamma chain|nr:gluconate 2-dehydrogenase subunit 3 family protein [Steroidobacteraceae bacterium]
MNHQGHGRRSALRQLIAAMGAVTLDWAAIAQAGHDAHVAAQSPTNLAYTLLAPGDAADVEALTSQIVPSDETPGAREAGVTFFIDRALGTLFAHWRESFMRGLGGFQAACRAHDPTGAAFAALSPERQIEFLHTIDGTPFFDQARMLTLCGMFSSPKYGGNRDGLGWKLIGFEDQHVFEPPFGYYDRIGS